MEYTRVRLPPADSRPASRGRPYVKQRRGKARRRTVRSRDELRLLRWRLKQDRMPPLPRRKDLERLAAEAERDLRRNAGLLRVDVP